MVVVEESVKERLTLADSDGSIGRMEMGLDAAAAASGPRRFAFSPSIDQLQLAFLSNMFTT